MEQKNLSKWLKTISLCLAAAAAVFYFLLLPVWARSAIEAEHYWYWMTFFWLTLLPNYLSLWQFWRICCQIGCDNSFSRENADSFRRISRILASEALLLFSGILLMFLAGMGHPNLCILLLLIMLAVLAVSILSAVLSHLVMKAYQLKQENDLTI
ncbi:MAG: DUF2975 domain-containing protein [Fusicatenibacter sp.]|nr:DUF2975 domain-containing protein [Fusicatenibacter sp.]